MVPFDVRLSNRNSLTSQIAVAMAPGGSNLPPAPMTIDFAQDQLVALRFQWGFEGDGFSVGTLETVIVERIPGV